MKQIDANVQTEYGEDDGYPARPTVKQRLRKTLVRAGRGVLGGTIYAAVSLWGGVRTLGRWGKRYPPLRPETFQPNRILVIRLDLIGDLVLSLVLVRVLKRTYPAAEIDLVAVPASAQVARDDPDIARLLGYDPNIWRRPHALLRRQNWRELRELLRTLRAREYDLAISVFGKWAAVLAALSGAHRTLGFGREGFPGLLTDSAAGRHWTRGEKKHEVDYCLELARAAGASIVAKDRYPRLVVSPQASEEIERLLVAEGVQAGRPLIACHVSANNGQSKRWPVPYWAALLDRLMRVEQVQVMLTGAPNDRALIAKIMGRMHEQPRDLAGKTSLVQLAALLKRADLLISGDSGPMHMAAAVGTSLIAIHGPTDPALSGPVSPQATILRSPIWCSPCYTARNTADCRFFTTQCMKDVTPAQVFDIVHKKLHERENENNRI